MLEHPNVPRTTNQITPTHKTPNISDDCPTSANPTTGNGSISSNIGEEWSNSISLNKMLPFKPGPILLDTRNPTEKSKIIDPHILRKMHPAQMLLKDQLQGDTGANCGAINDISILWYDNAKKNASAFEMANNKKRISKVKETFPEAFTDNMTEEEQQFTLCKLARVWQQDSDSDAE
jgi:hypothetical protein